MKVESLHTCFIAAIVLLLCSVNVAGQEPVDSTTLSKYTEYETPSKYTESDIIYLSDTTDLTNFFPVDTFSLFAHSPAKAAIMAAVVPGLGQIYNKKYWKLPIVYVAIGISVERFITFQNEFSRYRRAYIDINDNDPYTNFHLTLGFSPNYYNEEQMRQAITKGKEKLRTWRDYAIVAVVASYALSIIDANVDAHLMDFSLDDNISLNIQPCFLANDIKSKIFGLTLQFTF